MQISRLARLTVTNSQQNSDHTLFLIHPQYKTLLFRDAFRTFSVFLNKGISPKMDSFQQTRESLTLQFLLEEESMMRQQSSLERHQDKFSRDKMLKKLIGGKIPTLNDTKSDSILLYAEYILNMTDKQYQEKIQRQLKANSDIRVVLKNLVKQQSYQSYLVKKRKQKKSKSSSKHHRSIKPQANIGASTSLRYQTSVRPFESSGSRSPQIQSQLVFEHRMEKYMEKMQCRMEKYMEKMQCRMEKYMETSERRMEKTERYIEKIEKHIEKNEERMEKMEKHIEKNERHMENMGVYLMKDRPIESLQEKNALMEHSIVNIWSKLQKIELQIHSIHERQFPDNESESCIVPIRTVTEVEHSDKEQAASSGKKSGHIKINRKSGTD